MPGTYDHPDVEEQIKGGARTAGKPPGALDPKKPDLSRKGPAPGDTDPDDDAETRPNGTAQST